MSIWENMSLPLLSTELKKPNGLLDAKKAQQNAQGYYSMLNVKAESIQDKMSRLSGGNQQKVMVGKSLGTHPAVLLLDEPTIGIDIKSREEIMENINLLTANTSTSVVYLANDFDELLRIADRILFFSEGKLFADVANDGLSHEDVIRIRDSAKTAVPEA